MEEKNLLVVNPLLYGEVDKYIWIGVSFEEHRQAQRLFDYLMKRNIYIKGFATNAEALFSLSMYHKKIYDIDTLDETCSMVFFDFYFDCLDMDLPDKVHRARILNPGMAGKNVVIWGSGIAGEYVYKILADYGIAVNFFVDSNKKMEGKMKCGLPIYKSDKIDELHKDVTVIEALDQWRNVDKNFYYCLESDEISKEVFCYDGTEKKKMFCLGTFWMFNHFVGKKIYIYGTGIVEREFAKYLKLLDFDFAGFLTDEFSDVDEEEDTVKYVEEILYEESWYVWAYDRGKIQKLNELGLVYFKDYYVKDYRFDPTINQRSMLDINLGHNYLSDSTYPGITVYGDEKESDFKIAVLGGSTTDATMYPFKSWPLLLYEELGEKNITIYNGGVCSYTSGQELIKLFRDMLQLKPDMVIVYDGYNDLAFNVHVQYPFTSLYLKKVFDYARVHVEENDDTDYLDGEDVPVCMGIESQQGWFGNWLSNIRTMYAISNERDIRFFGFCQPVLSSKKEHTIREKNILLSMLSETLELFTNESFRKHIERMAYIPEYIYDLSHIFDEEDDVYMDVCHVWEKGNSIIAKEIKKVILPWIHR